MENFSDLSTKLNKAQLRCANKMGVLQALSARKVSLTEEVGLAKGRLALQPQVDTFLEELQADVHERTVGFYEQVMSALVGDVMGYENRVGFELNTSRGNTSLDIFGITEAGDTIDLVNGAGGSMTNVVTMGLRAMSTVRSGLRKFIALDEPDCWISPDRIPKFYNVLDKLNRKTNMQSLIISHHNSDLFPEDFNICQLRYVDDQIVAEQDAPHSWNNDEVGIRRITLKNFMSHADTTLHLKPGVNALLGENNIGKSVIIRALRAVAYGELSDRDIKHGEDFLAVEVEIEGGYVLSVTRFAKKNPKNTWEIKTESGDTHLSEDRSVEYKSIKSSQPAWISEFLQIAKIEELDLQLSHQKFPVFLLNESPAKRASMLSIGKDTSYVQEMISQQKENLKKDKQCIKSGENEISVINEQLITQDNLREIEEQIIDLQNELPMLQQAKNDIAVMAQLIQDLERTEAQKNLLTKSFDIIEKINNVDAHTLTEYASISELKDILIRATHSSEKIIKLNPKIAILQSLGAVTEGSFSITQNRMIENSKIAALKNEISQKIKIVSHLSKRMECYNELTDDLKVHETEEIAKLVSKLTSWTKQSEITNARVNILSSIPIDFVNIHDLSVLAELGKPLELAIRSQHAIQQKLSVLTNIPSVLDLKETEELSGLIKNIKSDIESISKTSETITELTSDIKAEENRLNDILQKSEIICPTCGNHNINANEVLQK